MVRSRWVSVVVFVGLVASACGGSGATTPSDPTAAPSAVAASTTTGGPTTTPVPTAGLIENGLVTEAALASLTTTDGIDNRATQALADAVLALPDAARTTALIDLSGRLELEAARVSGLETAVSTPADTEAALRGAWAPILAAVPTIGAAVLPEPTTPGRSARANRLLADDGSSLSADNTGSFGVVMGSMALGLTADSVVSAANGFGADQYSEKFENGTIKTGAVEQSSFEAEFQGNQNGVHIDFKAQAVVHPCPKADGSFDIQGKLVVKTSKNGVGTNASFDLAITGTVDDDAQLVSTEVTDRAEWADFSGGKGSYVDFTVATTNGTISGYSSNRGGGTTSPSMFRLAALMEAMFRTDFTNRYVDAARKAWQSGRCVDLKLSAAPGPKGLKPSSTAKVLAEPRSKVDGAAVGGTVTATLSSGGADVAPSATKVAADATFTYTAPAEKNKNGTIAAESRSKRGVGKRSITLDTAVPAAFHIVGGLDDFQADQDVCDVLAPFTLTGGGFTLSFSGGLTGTYTYTGPFAAQGNGTYEIRLADDPTKPGTMVGGGEGSVDTPDGRFSNAGTERYTLTPIDPC